MQLFSHIIARGAFTDLLRLEPPAAEEIPSDRQQTVRVMPVIYGSLSRSPFLPLSPSPSPPEEALMQQPSFFLEKSRIQI